MKHERNTALSQDFMLCTKTFSIKDVPLLHDHTFHCAKTTHLLSNSKTLILTSAHLSLLVMVLDHSSETRATRPWTRQEDADLHTCQHDCREAMQCSARRTVASAVGSISARPSIQKASLLHGRLIVVRCAVRSGTPVVDL